MKKRTRKTNFLLPSISFLTGLGSVFNIAGNFNTFKTSKTDEEADYRALQNDWEMIGQDFENAFNEVEKRK